MKAIHFLTVVTAACLVACGGGGNDSPTAPAVATVVAVVAAPAASAASAAAPAASAVVVVPPAVTIRQLPLNPVYDKTVVPGEYAAGHKALLHFSYFTDTSFVTQLVFRNTASKNADLFKVFAYLRIVSVSTGLEIPSSYVHSEQRDGVGFVVVDIYSPWRGDTLASGYEDSFAVEGVYKSDAPLGVDVQLELIGAQVHDWGQMADFQLKGRKFTTVYDPYVVLPTVTSSYWSNTDAQPGLSYGYSTSINCPVWCGLEAVKFQVYNLVPSYQEVNGQSFSVSTTNDRTYAGQPRVSFSGQGYVSVYGQSSGYYTQFSFGQMEFVVNGRRVAPVIVSDGKA